MKMGLNSNEIKILQELFIKANRYQKEMLILHEISKIYEQDLEIILKKL